MIFDNGDDMIGPKRQSQPDLTLVAMEIVAAADSSEAVNIGPIRLPTLA
jgi:hypothetical protein